MMTASNATLNLPTLEGKIEPFRINAGAEPIAGKVSWSRIAYAASHVVADPFADNNPSLDVVIDWDATLAFREYLWSLGFGVAEAMDTAQRGMGLDWPKSLELIQRSTALAKSGNHLIASGAGTDHLEINAQTALDDIIGAYELQCEAVEATGSRVILMASRALAAVAQSGDDYLQVYSRVLNGLAQPAILHWLGDMFDPALAGYWGSKNELAAMDVCLDVINANAVKIDGIKISLLSAEKEISMRRRLPPGVQMYTGDDFNYPELIEGDDQGYSHALLGIFDPIAGVAAKALSALGAGDSNSYHQAFDPTIALSRHIFRTPTRFYKTGVVFMAYLHGHQNHFTMVAGQECARSTLHLAQIVRLASDAGLFPDPELAAHRAQTFFAVRGVNI
jgi:hypothetical protein